MSIVDDVEEHVGSVITVSEIAYLVDLCGAPHKSTDVKHLIMWSGPAFAVFATGF